MKNYQFLDSGSLSLKQEQCTFDYIQSSQGKPTSNGFQQSSQGTSVFNSCGISSSYLTLPIKTSCLNSLASQCSKVEFEKTISFISSNINSGTGVCDFPPNCVNNPSDSSCGSDLYDMYFMNGIRPNYEALLRPCKLTASSTIGINPVFIQTAQTTYRNTANMTPAQQSQYNAAATQSSDSTKSNTFQIDGSNPGSPATNVNSDMKIIDSNSNNLISSNRSSFLKAINAAIFLFMFFFLFN